jgi:hypothetical protein
MDTGTEVEPVHAKVKEHDGNQDQGNEGDGFSELEHVVIPLLIVFEVGIHTGLGRLACIVEFLFGYSRTVVLLDEGKVFGIGEIPAPEVFSMSCKSDIIDTSYASSC